MLLWWSLYPNIPLQSGQREGNREIKEEAKFWTNLCPTNRAVSVNRIFYTVWSGQFITIKKKYMEEREPRTWYICRAWSPNLGFLTMCKWDLQCLHASLMQWLYWKLKLSFICQRVPHSVWYCDIKFSVYPLGWCGINFRFWRCLYKKKKERKNDAERQGNSCTARHKDSRGFLKKEFRCASVPQGTPASTERSGVMLFVFRASLLTQRMRWWFFALLRWSSSPDWRKMLAPTNPNFCRHLSCLSLWSFSPPPTSSLLYPEGESSFN